MWFLWHTDAALGSFAFLRTGLPGPAAHTAPHDMIMFDPAGYCHLVSQVVVHVCSHAWQRVAPEGKPGTYCHLGFALESYFLLIFQFIDEKPHKTKQQNQLASVVSLFMVDELSKIHRKACLACDTGKYSSTSGRKDAHSWKSTSIPCHEKYNFLTNIISRTGTYTYFWFERLDFSLSPVNSTRPSWNTGCLTKITSSFS